MKRTIKTSLILLILFCSCYKEDGSLPSELSGIINLFVENNYQFADGTSKIKVTAEFPWDFNTEDDNKVKFIISGRTTIQVLEDIRLVEDNGIKKKIAETLISTKYVETLNVSAVILVNKVEITKAVEVSFKRAFCESINLSSSSLLVKPDSSFDEISITTNLVRDIGFVSIGTEAETIVVDTNGISKGIFDDYKYKTDSTGTIRNKFTMGNDLYKGQLFVISKSTDVNNSPKTDTLIIYSQI